MNGNNVALDTNQAIAWLNGFHGLDAWIKQFDQIYLPVIVVGELRFGALKSQHRRENISKIEAIISRCAILNIDAVTAEVYARLRLELLKKGRPIPENDLWIAAICVQHALQLATADSHFSAVPDLRVIVHS